MPISFGTGGVEAVDIFLSWYVVPAAKGVGLAEGGTGEVGRLLVGVEVLRVDVTDEAARCAELHLAIAEA